MTDNKNMERDTKAGSEELGQDELDQVSGGAAYLKLGDIKGEALEGGGHKEWIELASYSATPRTR
jgi:hypothetical protein